MKCLILVATVLIAQPALSKAMYKMRPLSSMTKEILKESKTFEGVVKILSEGFSMELKKTELFDELELHFNKATDGEPWTFWQLLPDDLAWQLAGSTKWMNKYSLSDIYILKRHINDIVRRNDHQAKDLVGRVYGIIGLMRLDALSFEEKLRQTYRDDNAIDAVLKRGELKKGDKVVTGEYYIIKVLQKTIPEIIRHSDQARNLIASYHGIAGFAKFDDALRTYNISKEH